MGRNRSISVILFVLILSQTVFGDLKSDQIGDCLLDYYNGYKMKLVCFESRFKTEILTDSGYVKCLPDNSVVKNAIIQIDFLNCEMSELPKGIFEIYPQVQELDVSQMKLETFQQEYLDSLSIERINASNNKLSNIPFFPENNNLKELDVSSNPIQAVSMISFANLTKLTHLNLANTGLSQLSPDTFLYQRYLQDINLSMNRLKLVDSVAFLPSFYSLQTLDLSINVLSELTEMPRSLFSNLGVLDVAYNNIECDYLQEFLMENDWENGLRLSKNADEPNGLTLPICIRAIELDLSPTELYEQSFNDKYRGSIDENEEGSVDEYDDED